MANEKQRGATKAQLEYRAKFSARAIMANVAAYFEGAISEETFRRRAIALWDTVPSAALAAVTRAVLP